MLATLNKKVLCKWLLTLGVTGICYFVLSIEVESFQIAKFVAATIFCILLLAFDLLDQGLIGVLMPFLWVITGCATWSEAMSGWTSTYPMMFIGCFTLTIILQRVGLLKRVGYKVIVLCSGSFNRTIFALYFACIVLMFLTFTVALPLAILLAIALARAWNIKKEDPETFAIVMAVVLGGVQSSPYIYSPVTMTMINGAVSAYVPGFEITWVQLIAHNLPVFAFNTIFLWVFLIWFGKKWPNAGKRKDAREYFSNALEEMGPITLDEKKVTATMLFMVVYMLISPVFGMDLSYGFLGAVLILALPFMNVCKTDDVSNALKSFGPLILLVLSFISIGTVGSSVGFTEIITTNLIPIMGGLGEVKSIYATLLIGVMANFVLTPGAMIMLLTGPVVQLATDLGYNALPHIYSIYLTEHAIFHPYEWPSYLAIYAFGLIKMNDFVKLCVSKTVIYLMFVCIFMVPWWLIITT